MKFSLSLIALLLSATAFANDHECKQSEKLQCTVQYLVRSNGKLSTQTKTDTQGYQLMDWDEPSLSYCEASTAFNDNKLYIQASVNTDHQITLSIKRSAVGGVDSDTSTTVVDASTRVAAHSHLSFSPELDMSANYKAPFSLVGADVSCRIVK